LTPSQIRVKVSFINSEPRFGTLRWDNSVPANLVQIQPLLRKVLIKLNKISLILRINKSTQQLEQKSNPSFIPFFKKEKRKRGPAKEIPFMFQILACPS